MIICLMPSLGPQVALEKSRININVSEKEMQL